MPSLGATWRNRNFYLKVVNAAAVVAIVAGYSWAAQAARRRAPRRRLSGQRSQTRGAMPPTAPSGSARGYGGTVTCA
ncbi:MAG: hypothetical protein ACLU37_09380 [Collinsella sp.]